MKFQKLTIHNIASIEDAVIDFEAQPLSDSEVFLITGKTGAGKSTILDAICLALYADTPRLDSTRMQGDTKDGEKTVKIDDPRQLMRRNTGEAFSSLTFIGSNGVHYEAIWSVARARKKVTGNMQMKDWQLKNLDTDHTLTKDREIEAEIKAAIGLDFNQFCRTTMLAQGEFTRFLNSKDDEKAEILEKITGVDIYSKIGAKVFAVTGQKEQMWKDAQRLVEGTRTLTDVEIGEKKEALSVLDNQYNELKSASDKDTAKRDWIKHEAELKEGVSAANDAFQKANEVTQSKEFKTKEFLIKDWNATIDARLWMVQMQNAETAKNEQKENLETLSKEFIVLLGGQKYAETEKRGIAEQIRVIDSYLEKENDKATVYENAQTIVSHLNAIADGRIAINQSKETIDKENKAMTEDYQPAYEKAGNNAQLAKESFAKDESEVQRHDDEVTALNLPGLRTQRDNAKELLGKITTAKERLETLTTNKAQHDATHKSLTEQKNAIEEKRKKLAEMDAPIHDAKIKMDVRKEDLDKQKDTIDKFASTLRLKLHVGDTCPVCRQEIVSELPHEEELSILVCGLQEAYNEAEKAYKNLVDAKVKVEAEIKSESNSYERTLKAFDEDTSVAVAEQKASVACKSCGIENIDCNTMSALDALYAKTSADVSILDSKIKEGETKEKKIKKLRKALDAKRIEVDELVAKVAVAEKAVNDCKSRITTAEALIRSKESEVETAEQIAANLIVSGSWKTDWKESPKKFAEDLTLTAKKYNESLQQKQILLREQETVKTNFDNVASVIASITDNMPQWKSIEPDVPSKVDDILGKANAIDNKVAVTLSQLKSAEDAYDTNKQQLDAFLANNSSLSTGRLITLHAYSSDDIMREDAELKHDRDEVVAKKTLFENAKSLLNEYQDKKPELTEEDTISALEERIAEYDKQLGEIGEKKGAINQELKTDAENRDKLGTLIEEADKKKAVYQKWSRMNQLIGDATGNKFRKIAQSYVLTSLIHSANSYMKTLTDRYTLKVTPGTFVISLEDAYQGFVSRAASTISGGESFLVSLSLALALSDIGQQWQVDTLFIDEGFGTLSGEPLQNAINTLRSLHTKAGRHVGIISHVEELQERIPVQIQVNQEGNNSSSKVKMIP